MSREINTSEYWDERFASGEWESSDGRRQTCLFATRRARMLRLPEDFAGTILDFGCGLGDAIPIYKSRFPKASFFGLDHSKAAIELCRKHYGEVATFIAGDRDNVPEVDVIIASNVLEHLEDDMATADVLLSKCSELYVFVPYMEKPMYQEHVNRYGTKSFDAFTPSEVKVFTTRGYSQYGRSLWIDTYLKNLLRPFFGKPLAYRRRQVMFRIRGQRAHSAN